MRNSRLPNSHFSFTEESILKFVPPKRGVNCRDRRPRRSVLKIEIMQNFNAPTPLLYTLEFCYMNFVAFWTVEDAGPYELVRVRRECIVGGNTVIFQRKQLSERAGSWWVSLRLGHAHVLTAHRAVIHSARAASLPTRLREPSEPAVRVDRLCAN